MVIKLTGEYVVDKVLRPSKARYAKKIGVGDKIKFILEMVDTTGASGGGNYTLYADMYVNGELRCNISQNEFRKLLGIFELSPINEI